MVVYITIWVIFAIIIIGIVISKEYKSRQAMLASKKRGEEEDYNRWLHKVGLHETSYFFNPSGVRILNGWRLWKMNVLKQ